MRLRLWQKLSFALSATAAAVAVTMNLSGGGWDAADFFVAFLAVVFAGWAGALMGALIEWRRGGAPFAPMFREGFGWYYRSRYWFRFAILFGAAWVGFLLLAETVALIAGEKEEARLFLTSKGASVLLIFLAVFAVEGAIIGGLVDLVKYLRKKK